MAGESQEESSEGAGVPDVGMPSGDAAADAPEASAQSASTAAADGSAGGTTVSIAVYRSSFPIVDWDLNDDASLTKAEWAWTGELPERGTPGAAIEWEAPSGYAEPTRAGFEFAGWSTDASARAGGYLGNEEPRLAMPEGAPSSGEYHLYALWTPLEYAVIFDLAKNPAIGEVDGVLESGASFLLNWSTADGVRKVTSLGDGSYRVDGFTMKEDHYDKVTRTISLPVPARSGFRFLGWAEPDGQSVAIDNAAKDGFALNPVRLPQIDGIPVLTARWAYGIGVTAPLSITFGDYDKTNAPDNPSLGYTGASAADDTVQSEADDGLTPGLSAQERYEAAGQAYFENTSWHSSLKVVGLDSVRDANANKVLTTFDSSKASEAQVLGGQDPATHVEELGERLLSLYPSASPGDPASGVHFRLSDSLGEEVLGARFVMGAQGKEGAKLAISYGLNLSTDPSDPSGSTPNHGLVLPTDDYEPQRIAEVSYEFAVASDTAREPISDNPFYIAGDGFMYGVDYIKAAAEDLSANGSSSRYYAQFLGYLNSDSTFTLTLLDGRSYAVRVVGICQDTISDTGQRAGLTFGFKEAFGSPVPFDLRTATNWRISYQNCSMKSVLDSSLASLLPPRVAQCLVGVTKSHRKYAAQYSSTATQQYSTETLANQTLFVPSYNEMFRANSLASDGGTFQYSFYAKGASARVINSLYWWTRSALTWSSGYNGNYNFYCVSSTGNQALTYGANYAYSVIPHFCL